MCTSHETQNCASKKYFIRSVVLIGKPQPGPSSFCILLISPIQGLQISVLKQLKTFERSQQSFALPSEVPQYKSLSGKQRVGAGLALGSFGSQGNNVCPLVWCQSSAFPGFSGDSAQCLAASRAPEHVFRMEQSLQC